MKRRRKEFGLNQGLWTCEVCNRRFAKRNQAHSCRRQKVGDHFIGKEPRLKRIFTDVITALEAKGPLRLDAVQSGINLISKYHFGAVAIRKNYLRIEFISDHEIHDPRIVRLERVGERRYAHFLNLSSFEDVDSQLIGWLAEAQGLQAH